MQESARAHSLQRAALVVVAALQAGHLLLHDAYPLAQLLHLLLQRHVLRTSSQALERAFILNSMTTLHTYGNM